MKRILLFSIFVLCFLSVTSVAQTRNEDFSILEKNLSVMQSRQTDMDKRLQQLLEVSKKNKHEMQGLVQENKTLYLRIDSLKVACEDLKKRQEADRTDFNGKIQHTNNKVISNQSVLEDRTLWGSIIVVVILFSLFAISYYFVKRIKRGSSSIDEVRKGQDALQSAQARMQEESIKLDNKLIELFEKQMPNETTMTVGTQTDHSLALKVADEIVRIEMNLSRMDASIKGYKQLSKAVQRIKDNFNANGYEIVDMLGKPYNSGMKATVTFVIDENLGNGEQIITKIIKPQINYQQQMIQVAQIEVSQPE